MASPNICCGQVRNARSLDINKLRIGVTKFVNGDYDAPQFDTNPHNAVNLVYQACITDIGLPLVSVNDMRNIILLEFEKNSRSDVVRMYDTSIVKLSRDSADSTQLHLTHLSQEKMRLLENFKQEQTHAIDLLDRTIAERATKRFAFLSSPSFTSFFLAAPRICHGRHNCPISNALCKTNTPTSAAKGGNSKRTQPSDDNMGEDDNGPENYFNIGLDRFTVYDTEKKQRCPVCWKIYESGAIFFNCPVSCVQALSVVFLNWKEFHAFVDSGMDVCFDCSSSAVKILENFINLPSHRNGIISYSVRLPILDRLPEYVFKIWEFAVSKLLTRGGIVSMDEIFDRHVELGTPKHILSQPHKLISQLKKICEIFDDVAVVASPDSIPTHPDYRNFAHGFIVYSGLHQNFDVMRNIGPVNSLKMLQTSYLGKYVGNLIAEEAAIYNRNCTRHHAEDLMECLNITYDQVVNDILPSQMPLTWAIAEAAFNYGLKNDNKKSLKSGQLLAIIGIANGFVNIVCARPKAYTQLSMGIALKYSTSQEFRLKVGHLCGLNASPSVVKKGLDHLKRMFPRTASYTEQVGYVYIADQCRLALDSEIFDAPIKEFSLQIDNLDYKIGSELSGTKTSANYCLVIGMVQQITNLTSADKEFLALAAGRYAHDDPIKAAIDKLGEEKGTTDALDSPQFSLEARQRVVRPFIHRQIFDVLINQNAINNGENSHKSTRICQRTELFSSGDARKPGDTTKTVLEVIQKKVQ